jgi:hypothetical protein
MKGFYTLVIVLTIHVLFSQTYVQSQEVEKPFPYESWKYLYEPKCSKCHPLDRIFADPKTEEEWKEIVADMRLLVREELKKDWFTHHESKIIVDLLVKTQGLEPEESIANKKEARDKIHRKDAKDAEKN